MIKFEIEQLHGHLIACCRRHIVIVGGRVYVSQHVQLFVGTYIEGTGHKRLNFCFVVKFYNCRPPTPPVQQRYWDILMFRIWTLYLLVSVAFVAKA